MTWALLSVIARKKPMTMTLSRAVARRGRRTQAKSNKQQEEKALKGLMMMMPSHSWLAPATTPVPPQSPLAILLSAIVRKKPMTMPLSRWKRLAPLDQIRPGQGSVPSAGRKEGMMGQEEDSEKGNHKKRILREKII